MELEIDPQDLANKQVIAAETTEKDARAATEAAENFISEKRLGERIKHLRLLSQLETGRGIPTLRNVARIARVFSKDLNYFFEPEPKTLFRVQRSKDRIRLPQSGTDDPSYYFESLGYLVPDRQLDPYFAEFLPNMTGRRAHQHPGCEFLYVVDGELDIVHGDVRHRLEAGDAVYFHANTPHSYSNSSSAPAKALIVTLQGSAAAAPTLNGGNAAKAKPPALANGASLRPRPEVPAATTH